MQYDLEPDFDWILLSLAIILFVSIDIHLDKSNELFSGIDSTQQFFISLDLKYIKCFNA